MATSVHPEPLNQRATPPTQGKINVVQGLRAVAALLVVWTHSIDAAAYYAGSRQQRFFHLSGFGACGLDIFFVISGFIVSLVAARAVGKGKHSARRFLSRRITRIFPLYWILTIVVILEIQLGTHRIAWTSISWLPTAFLLPSISYPAASPILSLGWSLVFEMYFYYVLTAWMAIRPRHLVRNTVGFLGFMVGMGALIGWHRPLLVIWSNPILFEFMFGCIIGQIYSNTGAWARPRMNRVFTPALGRSLTALGAAALVVTLFTGYGMANYQGMVLNGLSSWIRVGVWGAPSGVLVLGAVLWSPAMQSWPARVLIFLGDASYSIYLCTNPARSAVEHFWRYFGLWGGDVGVLLCGIVCVAVGVACYLIVERPLMRFFHNWYKQIPFQSMDRR
jgi:exopolysaccharide production protein ExoZ